MLSSTAAHKRPILFLDHAHALGGAERSLLLLLNHLDPQRWSPHLGCVSGPLAQHAIAHGVPTHILDLPRLRRSPRLPLDWLVGAREIARLADQIEAKLLIANTVRAAFYCALASRFIAIPYIWHMRDFWLSETRPRQAFFDDLGKRSLCRAASLVIANSAATASHLPCTDKVYVVHNGIDVNLYSGHHDSAVFRKRHHIPLHAQVVGMVGRMRPWKGQERFLHMARQVLAILPETHFVLVGGDPFQVDAGYERDLRRLTQDLGISESVTFTGHLEDIRPALASMHVFVHPGDPEPFGLVNLEAMASGKPVAAFAHGALPEIVVPDDTGILVPSGNIDALSRAVVDLLQDPDRLAGMGRCGRQRVKKHFSVQQAAAGVSQLFGQVIQ